MEQLNDLTLAKIGQSCILEIPGDAHLAVASYVRKHLLGGHDMLSELHATTFLIEHARQLKEIDSRINKGEHIILVSFDKIVEAAQHALLKTIEEPKEKTHILFVVRNKDVFLPTILSRAPAYHLLSVSPRLLSLDPETYLSASFSERLEYLSPLLDTARGDEGEERDSARRELLAFLESLLECLASRGFQREESWQQVMRLLFEAERDMQDISPSLKMIFEHLSLRLPQVSPAGKSQKI